MLSFASTESNTCNGPSRREFLRLGGLAASGVTLSNWYAQKVQAAEDQLTTALPKDVNCILCWMIGGPSHVETWDMKPDAPQDVRGEFQSIATNRPGFRVCELMPKLAQITEKYSVIRSMTSVTSSHPAGHYYVNSGRLKTPVFTPAGYGAVLMQQKRASRDVPGFVQLGKGYRPDVGKAGYLGQQHNPIVVGDDPNRGPLNVREFALPEAVNRDRLQGRQRLLHALDSYQAEVERQASASPYSSFQEKAFSIISSPKTKQSFNLSQESDAIREQYGRNRVGQRMLLARRLIEAGVRFVRLQAYMASGYDTHFHHWKRMKQEVPCYDQGYAALLTDLEQRGLLENTLVVTVGEFGRTPRINKERGGRDHWSRCFSLSLAGGGLHKGVVVGASDKIGALPASRALKVPDLAHTIYHALGLDPRLETHSSDGRPIIALPDGQPIAELI